jgi:hypothetical protein
MPVDGVLPANLTAPTITRDAKCGVMLINDGQVVWSERAAMKDLFLNPFFMATVAVLTLVFGLGLLPVYGVSVPIPQSIYTYD